MPSRQQAFCLSSPALSPPALSSPALSPPAVTPPAPSRSAPHCPARMAWATALLAAAAVVGPASAAAPAAKAPPVAPCASRSFDFDAATWKPAPMSKRKRHTVYELAREADRHVLIARADASASFYVARLAAPVQPQATLAWSWKTDALVPGADNRERAREDAPLRVVVAFDGDASKLPARERSQRNVAKTLAGVEPPYAVLMYIWSDQVAPETVIPSSFTGQVKMIAVASGAHGLGQWQAVQRDLAADYRKVFGAEPGPLLGMAVLTDTDNTGAKAVGHYADFRLQCGAR